MMSNLNHFFPAKRGESEGYAKIGSNISSSGWSRRATTATAKAKEVAEHIAQITHVDVPRKATAKRACAAGWSPALSTRLIKGLAVLIVLLTLLCVTQDLICFVDFFELLGVPR
jgi:hypothetical protein